MQLFEVFAILDYWLFSFYYFIKEPHTIKILNGFWVTTTSFDHWSNCLLNILPSIPHLHIIQ